MTTTIPAPSEATAAAVANIVDYTIDAEHGSDVTSAIRGARMIALAGLTLDLGEQAADTTLRILVRDGLAARTCQCRQIHPHGCPHGSAVGSLWCSGHYESDVPATDGALLCGTCHVAEHQAA